MSESKPPACPRCGAGLPAGSVDRPCPACLMSGALAKPDALAAPDAVKGQDGEAGNANPTAGPLPDGTARFPCEFGGYRLLGLLGTGGMGKVFEAEELATSRRVALKMLEGQIDSPEMRRRFLREGRLAASVSHPNSLYIFGSEEIDNVPVITMEVAGGGTLDDRLKAKGPLPVDEAVDAILDVIAGLEAASSGGVLHRDVKPSNCFVSPDGSVKVGDFGLSVSTLASGDSYATATGVIMGTPAFAPPEQLRGDDLDLRADIYSVGATLFTLLTGKAPFRGKNAVQVVANAVNAQPDRVSALRDGVPPGLDRVVARCLAKERSGRYADYAALRDALLPFCSRERSPASLNLRASAGWIDYLIAFLVPYVPLMLFLGNDEFHLRFFMERTLLSAWHHGALLGFAVLYFALAEGIRGAGVGKGLKGLRVVRTDGRRPGVLRALIRIAIPLLCIEGVRIPLLLATIAAREIDAMTVPEIVVFTTATALCPWIPVLASLTARRENGFATLWDRASGTRVVLRPKGERRPAVEVAAEPESAATERGSLGPFLIVDELVPGRWIVADDPVLRRRVWLIRRGPEGIPSARRDVDRPGRLRWLQKVEAAGATFDAFEAVVGVPIGDLVGGGKRVPWATLRHWLHDLASELWAATGDGTLPDEPGLDHVRITAAGRAVLLDEPWPGREPSVEGFSVGDVAGQQRFLSNLARHGDPTGLPLHARPLLRNLAVGKFEKLSFLTGTLRGLLEKPSEVGAGIRAGSIFMLPLYVWIMVLVGACQEADWIYAIVGDPLERVALAAALLVAVGSALFQLLELPFRTTGGQAIFRLAVVDAAGEPASGSRLLLRWAIAWLPLLVPMTLVTLLTDRDGSAAFYSALVLLLLWIGAAIHAALHQNRGLHDRLAGTRVVRR